MAIPPADEQERVVERIEQILSDADAIDGVAVTSKKRAQLLRQSILKAAFEGKLVPQDPNDEPASVLLERIREEREKAGGEKKTRRGKAAPKAQPRPSRRAMNDAARMSPEATSPQGADDRTMSTAREGLVEDHPDRVVHRAAYGPSPDYSHLDDQEQADLVYSSIAGHGPIPVEEALRLVAEELRRIGSADFQRLRRDGPLWTFLDKAIKTAVRFGYVDRPKRGHVRAFLPDPKQYDPQDWRNVVELSGANEIDDLEEAIRVAAEWAKENLGLEFERLRKDGVIWNGIEGRLRPTAPSRRERSRT